MDDGPVIELKRGDILYIPPGHDSWVIGDEPYVSLHLMVAADYAASPARRDQTAANSVSSAGLAMRILSAAE
jgi:quercetin dioxygenase-like cupin family protein